MKTKFALVMFVLAAFAMNAAAKQPVQLVALGSCCQGKVCQHHAADPAKACWKKMLSEQMDDQVVFGQSMNLAEIAKKSVVLIQPCCKAEKSVQEMENALMEQVSAAKKQNLKVILLTPVTPCVYKEGEFHMVLGAYPEAIRRVAKRMSVPVLDIQALTEKWILSLGEEKAQAMYACKCSLNAEGAKEVARLAAQEIQSKNIKPLSQHIVFK